MRLIHVCALGILSAAAAACSKDTGGQIVTPGPLAGLRYVNLVPDTIALDFRVVDIVGNAPNTVAAAFRTGGSPSGVATALLPPHQGVRAGTREISVFLNGTTAAVAGVRLLNQTFTFTEGSNYTIYLYGYSNPANGTPALTALLVEDAAADPGAGNVSTRVINLAPTLAPTLGAGTVDVWVDGNAAATAPAGAPTFAALALGEVRTWVTRATGAGRVVVASSGTTAPFIEAALPAGTAGTSTSNPVAGSGVAGTAMTIVIAPPSAAGTGAPQTAGFGAPALLTLIDRHPPRTAP